VCVFVCAFDFVCTLDFGCVLTTSGVLVDFFCFFNSLTTFFFLIGLSISSDSIVSSLISNSFTTISGNVSSISTSCVLVILETVFTISSIALSLYSTIFFATSILSSLISSTLILTFTITEPGKISTSTAFLVIPSSTAYLALTS
jgi:hypothetical protein